jgi:hypothetical protein
MNYTKWRLNDSTAHGYATSNGAAVENGSAWPTARCPGVPSPALADAATLSVPLQAHFGALDALAGFR